MPILSVSFKSGRNRSAVAPGAAAFLAGDPDLAAARPPTEATGGDRRSSYGPLLTGAADGTALRPRRRAGKRRHRGERRCPARPGHALPDSSAAADAPTLAASYASSTSTISPISQSRSVTFAAIAGVIRSDLW